MRAISIFLTAAIFALSSCSEDNLTDSDGMPNNSKSPDEEQDDNGWLIPVAEVRDGGPGKDGIPSIDEPEFINANDADYLNDDDLVLGFADGSEVRAYPHKILDWHEIINDDTPNHSLAVIYCPLTGTGIGWDRNIDGENTTFGVSGLLYNSNIIPYDRASESNWSQLLLKSVNGSLKGTRPTIHNLVETSWKTWKTMFPNSNVLSLSTGYNRNYERYPYGTYKTSENLLFPVSNSDSRMHQKERVLAVFENEKAIAFRFNQLENNDHLITALFNDKTLVVTGDEQANLLVAFDSKLPDGTVLDFQYLINQLPNILTDNEGNTWDIFGRAIDGPRKGEKLIPVPQMIGYWFAFAAFYPEIEL
jgi:hypothetical protein